MFTGLALKVPQEFADGARRDYQRSGERSVPRAPARKVRAGNSPPRCVEIRLIGDSATPTTSAGLAFRLHLSARQIQASLDIFLAKPESCIMMFGSERLRAAAASKKLELVT
jgi:hypothetical protein